MNFKRSPRILPELPEGKVEIISPPSPPPEPSTSLTTILIPIGGFAISMAIMVTVNASGSGLGISMLYSVPMMLGTGVVSLINYRSQRKKYKKEMAERQQNYEDYLVTQRKDLEQMYFQQSSALLEIDPAPGECLRLVFQTDSRIWERCPDDPDFLSLRLGLGDQPFIMEVKPPPRNPTKDTDPLVEEAYKITKSVEVVQDVPVRFPLVEARIAGISGERSSVLNLTRALIIQITTHHAPSEVKIMAIFPANERDNWDWMRWLPHVWTDDRRNRFLACHKKEAHDLLAGLYNQLQRRARAIEIDQDKDKILLPT
ncbi:MAG: type VII secretion protein EssC, partial [Chloroflexi bacterium]|nr:type VII secretion protein EssC [Chloroflexota bacterium]